MGICRKHRSMDSCSSIKSPTESATPTAIMVARTDCQKDSLLCSLSHFEACDLFRESNSSKMMIGIVLFEKLDNSTTTSSGVIVSGYRWLRFSPPDSKRRKTFRQTAVKSSLGWQLTDMQVTERGRPATRAANVFASEDLPTPRSPYKIPCSPR